MNALLKSFISRRALTVSASIALALAGSVSGLNAQVYDYDSLSTSPLSIAVEGQVTISGGSIVSGYFDVGPFDFTLDSSEKWVPVTDGVTSGYYVSGGVNGPGFDLDLYNAPPFVGQDWHIGLETASIGSLDGTGVWVAEAPDNQVSTSALFLLSLTALGFAARRFKAVSA